MQLQSYHIEQAKTESERLACYINQLHLHGVCGTMKPLWHEQVRRFLDKHGIAYDFNQDGTIWMPTLCEGLQTIFQINRPI